MFVFIGFAVLVSGLWIVLRAASAQSVDGGGSFESGIDQDIPDMLRDPAIDGPGPDGQSGCVAQAGVLCIMIGLLIVALALAAE